MSMHRRGAQGGWGMLPRAEGSVPGSAPGAVWCLEAGDLQQLSLTWAVRPGAGLRSMASLGEAWSYISCIFLGFSVPFRNFRAHRQWHGWSSKPFLHASMVSSAGGTADGYSPGVLRTLWLSYRGVLGGQDQPPAPHWPLDTRGSCWIGGSGKELLVTLV